MVSVDIEYCVPCGLLDPAVKTQRELLESFGRDLEGVTLTTGHGGVFKVRVDGEMIWDKDDHDGRIDLDAIGSAVEERIETV